MSMFGFTVVSRFAFCCEPGSTCFPERRRSVPYPGGGQVDFSCHPPAYPACKLDLKVAFAGHRLARRCRSPRLLSLSHNLYSSRPRPTRIAILRRFLPCLFLAEASEAVFQNPKPAVTYRTIFPTESAFGFLDFR